MSDKANEFLASIPENIVNADFNASVEQIAAKMSSKYDTLGAVPEGASASERAKAAEAVFSKELTEVTENLPVVLERLSLAHEDLKSGMKVAHEGTHNYVKRSEDALLAFKVALDDCDSGGELADIRKLFDTTKVTCENSLVHLRVYENTLDRLNNPTDRDGVPYRPDKIKTVTSIVMQHEKGVADSTSAFERIKSFDVVTDSDKAALRISQMTLESADNLFLTPTRRNMAVNESIVRKGDAADNVNNRATRLSEDIPSMAHSFQKLYELVKSEDTRKNLFATGETDDNLRAYSRMKDAAEVLESLSKELSTPEKQGIADSCADQLTKYREFADTASNFLNVRFVQVQANRMFIQDVRNLVVEGHVPSAGKVADTIRATTNFDTNA